MVHTEIYPANQSPFTLDILANRYLSWFNDPVTRRYLADTTPRRLEEIVSWLTEIQTSQLQAYYFIVTNGELVGHVGLKALTEDWQSAEIGVVIGKRLGIGTYVVSELINKSQSLGVRHFFAIIHPDNLASKKLFTKLNFSKTDSLTLRNEEIYMLTRQLDFYLSPPPSNASLPR